MAEKTLDNLFYDTLKDIYYAERKILKGLKKMSKGAQAPELKAAFDKRLREDKAFAADPQARLQWFYQRTPFYDVNAFVYPVGVVF